MRGLVFYANQSLQTRVARPNSPIPPLGSTHLSQSQLHWGNPLTAKTKNGLLCNFFAIADSFPFPAKREWVLLRLISCSFVPRSAIRGQAAIPNRKKVAIWSAILFWVSETGLGGAGGQHPPSRTLSRIASSIPIPHFTLCLRCCCPRLPCCYTGSPLSSAAPFHTFVERVT